MIVYEMCEPYGKEPVGNQIPARLVVVTSEKERKMANFLAVSY